MATSLEKLKKKYGNDIVATVASISKKTGIPASILDEVAVRASGAWRSNLASVRLKSGEKNPDTKRFPRSARMSREQWIGGRLAGFAIGNPKQVTKGAPDSDLW